MPLIKQRPDIRLLAPREIPTGRPFDLRAELTCPADLPVNSIEIELVGMGVYYSHSQYGRHRHESAFSRSVAHVAAGGELTAGHHAYVGRFELAADVPGNYQGKALRIEWIARVHVDIPWWPDARATYNLHVVGNPPPTPVMRKVFVSDAAGPKGNKPYAELSLGTTEIESGGSLAGAVALSNTSVNQYRALRLALVAVETLPSSFTRWVEHVKLAQWSIPLDEPVEDEPVRFSLRLPTGLSPGFETRSLRLEWFLELTLDVAWALDPSLWVPVVVRPRAIEGNTGMIQPPLAVGSERLALVWAKAAERTRFNLVDEELVMVAGKCEARVRRHHQGRRGVILVGELTFPDLGVGLELAPGGRSVETRDAAQTAALMSELGDRLALCPPDYADDTRMRCERDETGTRVDPLVAFVEAVGNLARAVASAIKTLPPPATMAEDVPEWKRAARSLGGRLRAASMDIEGTREEVPFAMRTQWSADGQPSSTLLEVRPTLPIDGRHHVHWERRQGIDLLPEGLDLAPIAKGAQELVITVDALRVSLGPRPRPVLTAVSKLEALIEIGSDLSGHGRLYR